MRCVVIISLIFILTNVFGQIDSIEISEIYLSELNISDNKADVIGLLGKPDSVTAERPIDFDYKLVEDLYYGRDCLLFIDDSLVKYTVWGDRIEFQYENITIGTSCDVLNEKFPISYSLALKHKDDYNEYFYVSINTSMDGLIYDDAILFFISKKDCSIYKIQYWIPF